MPSRFINKTKKAFALRRFVEEIPGGKKEKLTKA